MKRPIKIALTVISVILAVVIAAIGTILILNRIGKSQFHRNDKNIKADNVSENDEGILYKKNRYILNQDIISFLLIGVDKGELNDNLGVGINGQADTLLVVAINTKTKNVTIIPISRETLVDVNQYNISGGYSGVEKKQICLAYAYGKTTEKCSENVLLSVSRVLYGINISSYITMDLHALEKISNSVGYVDVYVNEDYYDYDSGTRYRAGQTIRVKGKSAVNYIHWRTNNVDANNYRMERQKSFIVSFINKAANTVSDDFSKVISYYNMMSPYVSTNISLSQTTYLATSCLRLNLGDSIDFKTIPGETFTKDGFSAFKPDEDALTDIVVDTFYKKVSKKSIK